MLDCIFDIFERYQTFVVGIIGFAGVMYTISKNAKLANIQHNRELEHERLSVRTALIEELGLIKVSYIDRINMFNTTEKSGTALIPVNVMNDAYLQLISKVGLLTTEEIKLVMTAYENAKELPIKLKFMATSDVSNYDLTSYINVDSSHFEHACKLHQKYLLDIDSALKELQNDEKHNAL